MFESACLMNAGKIGLQNVHGATDIFFNPDIEEAHLLKQKYSEINEGGSVVLSQLCDSSKSTPEDEFLTFTNRKSIEELKTSKEVHLSI